jgi:REP element-mobilizing transposase RayT
MPLPLAYFLTWICYGTRVHGDERGSVDMTHNTLNTPLLPPDPLRERLDRSLMRSAPVTLSPAARQIVDEVIRQHCEIRGWRLLALNVRTNHVHVVVDCLGRASPETAMEQFKAWATRRLRGAGLMPKDQKVWAEHGSTRWVGTAENLAEAIDYVLNRQ